MITPRRADIRLHALEAILSDIRRDAPRALTAIHARINEHDGYPAGSSEVAVHTSPTDSSVERAATRNERFTQAEQDIDEHITATAQVLGDFLEVIRPWIQRSYSDAEKQAMLCSHGSHLAGYLTWGDPLCANPAEPGRGTGLCVSCRGRRERWQRRQQQRHIA